MKKRSSVDKAECADSREEQYRKDSQDIIIKNDEQIEIAIPYKSKTFWYESWLKIKEFYGV